MAIAHTSDAPAKTVAVAPDQGERFTNIGGSIKVLIDGETSGGRCCMFECRIPPGHGPPMHTHVREDELFYVLKGRFKFSIDGTELIGEQGFFACAPRGSVHAFKNVGQDPGLLHVTCTPAGFEVPFRAVRVPEPESGQAPPTMEQVIEIFGRHGVTFVGPPLEG